MAEATHDLVQIWSSSAWRRRFLKPANVALQNAPRTSIAALSLIWIALVGLADYWTGPDVSMLIFYLIPVTLGTWFVGQNFGLFLAILSIATSAVSDLASGLAQVRYWNEAVGFLSYVIFVSLLSRWRELLNHLENRVRARTAALEEEINQRAALQKEMSELTERERRRLGHDLHDKLCQHLTGTALSAQLLCGQLGANGRTEAQQAEKVVELIESGIDLTRNLARGLFSPDLDGGGLAVALEILAESTRERFGIECEFQHDSKREPNLERPISTQLYRIAQEAIANAGKHARASRIIIELDTDEEELTLNIFDNGIGFDGETSANGLGLRMMRHGAESIGSSFSIRKNCAAGTVVSCAVKLR